jgi:large subunit ribosomal protein L4
MHAERGSLAVFDASAFDSPSTRQAAELLGEWGAVAPTVVVLGADEATAGKSFRNIARVTAIPAGDLGVAQIIGAASLLVSEVAMPALVARAAGRAREDEG